MACYRPKILIQDMNKPLKAKDGHTYWKQQIMETDQLENFDKWMPHLKISQIPCKTCAGCQLDYSREWANRGYLESLSYEHNYFLTLTVDEDHRQVPEEITTKNGVTFTNDFGEWEGTLEPDDMTKFMKDLRAKMKYDYGKDNIRFMLCGEYGSNTYREHYHVILFNCPLPEESFYDQKLNWKKNWVSKNKIIEKVWDKGLIEIAEANWNTIAYVARYITKKINGPQSEEMYAMEGMKKEFFRTSRNPGIGYQYYIDHKEEIYKYDKILIKDDNGSRYIKPPKYYDAMYEKENPEAFEKIKENRKKENIYKLRQKAEKTSLNRWEQFQIELATKESQAMTLKREL